MHPTKMLYIRIFFVSHKQKVIKPVYSEDKKSGVLLTQNICQTANETSF